MKRVWRFIKKHADIAGLILHTAWLGVGIKYGFTETQQVTGHLIIGNATGYGLYGRYQRNKESINDAIEKTKNYVTGKQSK